jgi:hypothetical protein
MEPLKMPSLSSGQKTHTNPEKAKDRSPQAMHQRFVKRLSSALTHSSAIFSTVLCLTLGGGLIFDAAVTNPTRFHALLENDDANLYGLTLPATAMKPAEKSKAPTEAPVLATFEKPEQPRLAAAKAASETAPPEVILSAKP